MEEQLHAVVSPVHLKNTLTPNHKLIRHYSLAKEAIFRSSYSIIFVSKRHGNEIACVA